MENREKLNKHNCNNCNVKNFGSNINYGKDKAMLEQKIEFLELKLKEKNEQMEDSKKSHEKIFQALQESSNPTTNKHQYEEFQNKHQVEIKELEMEFEKIKKKQT